MRGAHARRQVERGKRIWALDLITSQKWVLIFASSLRGGGGLGNKSAFSFTAAPVNRVLIVIGRERDSRL